MPDEKPRTEELCDECELRIGDKLRLSAALDALDLVRKELLKVVPINEEPEIKNQYWEALARAKKEIERRYSP